MEERRIARENNKKANKYLHSGDNRPGSTKTKKTKSNASVDTRVSSVNSRSSSPAMIPHGAYSGSRSPSPHQGYMIGGGGGGGYQQQHHNHRQQQQHQQHHHQYADHSRSPSPVLRFKGQVIDSDPPTSPSPPPVQQQHLLPTSKMVNVQQSRDTLKIDANRRLPPIPPTPPAASKAATNYYQNNNDNSNHDYDSDDNQFVLTQQRAAPSDLHRGAAQVTTQPTRPPLLLPAVPQRGAGGGGYNTQQQQQPQRHPHSHNRPSLKKENTMATSFDYENSDNENWM